MTKLTDLCDFQYGYAFDSGAFTDDDSYPQLVRIRDVKRGYSETFYSGSYPEEYVLSAGDLLIGMDGEFNIARWNIDGALLNQRVCKIIVKDNIDEEYLRFALSKALKTIEDRTSFATVKHLSAKELNKLELDVPRYEDQVKRSTALSKLEAIMKRRQDELDKLDNLIKARFVEMFGDSNNSKGYPLIKVQDVADIQVGVVIKPAQYYTDAEHGVKAFRSLNIGEMTIKDNDWVYFNEEGQKKNSKSTLRENDIVIVRSGAPGTACVVTNQFVGANAVDVIIAHPNTEMVNPYYLCAFTNYPHGKRQIEAGTGGAAQQHFNVGKYKDMDLIYPPKEEQDKFVSFVKQVDKSKVVIQKALNETQTLFDSLMQEFFG